jgi:type I restriction enzyme S subunit
VSVAVEVQKPNGRFIAKRQLSLIREFDLLTNNAGGVAKLRQLVRSLAARGLLTSQFKADESADQLLARLNHLKRAGVVASRAKAVVAKNDLLANRTGVALPHGWSWASLAEMGSFASGKTPSTDNSEFWNGDIPWVTPKDMKWTRVVDSEDHVSEKAVADGLAVVPKQAVLIVVRSGILRRTVPVAIASVRCTINQDLKALTLYEPLMAPYVRLLVSGFEPFILAYLTKVGTTVESIKFDDFAGCRFPIPPLAEQQRIVARVEELMKLCDSLEQSGRLADEQHARLTSTLFDALAASKSTHALAENWQRLAEHFDLLLDRPEAIAALEATIVQLGVRGKLMRQDWASAVARELPPQIVARKKSGARGPHLDMEDIDPEHRTPLPRGWVWTRLEDISMAIVDCPHSTPKFVDTGLLCVDTNSFKGGRLLPHRLRYVNEQTFRDRVARLKPQPGDLVFAREGSVGESLIIPPGVVACLGQRVMLFRFSNLAFNEFVRMAITSTDFLSMLLGMHKGIGAKHVNVGDMRRAVIPLPPLREQVQIVGRVQELLLLCGELRERLAASKATQSRLADALVQEVA